VVIVTEAHAGGGYLVPQTSRVGPMPQGAAPLPPGVYASPYAQPQGAGYAQPQGVGYAQPGYAQPQDALRPVMNQRSASATLGSFGPPASTANQANPYRKCGIHCYDANLFVQLVWLARYTSTEVGGWIASIGFPQHRVAFEAQNFDGDAMAALDLSGITTPVHAEL
jgi:hypothetical protein